jgi:NAD(P)-dependent dehydrogenase (short-subunit alcohol dehydrogenase family)
MSSLRTAIVTGGTRGIGFHVARLLVESGQIGRLVVVGRTPQSVDKAIEALKSDNRRSTVLQKLPEVVGLPADLSQIAEIQHLASVRRFSGL